jgi:ubiquinone/menaquinone biosynthesis C-methylase UbiE
MTKNAIRLEETRLKEVHDLSDYNAFHERHRIFPGVFQGRDHKRILDIAAGVGIVGKRVQEHYPAEIICNDISPKCLKIMRDSGLNTVSFDIDVEEEPFPFPDNHFDAVVALATIEHVIHIDHFLQEIYRILREDGCFYISAPNYSGLVYLLPFLLSGKTFHDPMDESSRYEFYGHVRYFTYRTLLEFVRSFGFEPIMAYLPLPKESSRFLRLKEAARAKALTYQALMRFIYRVFSPRWAAEPVLCFQKHRLKSSNKDRKIPKVVL